VRPERLTYSFLRTYKQCRQRALLQYIKRVIPASEVNHRPFIVGLVADWLFGKWVTTENFAHNWMENKAEAMFEWFTTKKRIVYKGADDKSKLIYKLKKSVRFLEQYSFQEELPKREIQMQKKVGKKMEGFNFWGKMDMWFPKEKAIWDLKITDSKRYMDEFQLYFFAWLMEELGHEVKGLAFFTPIASPYLREVHWRDGDRSVREKFEQELFELLELIREDRWERNAKNCWGCPVVKWCDLMDDIKSSKLKGGGFRVEL